MCSATNDQPGATARDRPPSILKYWQLLECFAWQPAPALDTDECVRSLRDKLPWPEHEDATCCAYIQRQQERDPKKRFRSVTWQHSVFLGIVAERKIVEELFRHRPEELELLPKDFRAQVPMLALCVTNGGETQKPEGTESGVPALDPESIEVARWPWALAQWIRTDGKPEAWASDFEAFRERVIEVCREGILRTKPAADGFFRLTHEAIAAIEAGLLDVLSERCAVAREQPLPPVFRDLLPARVQSRFRSDANAAFDPPLLNSFFVDDLSRAVEDVTKGKLGGALDRYVEMNTGLEKIDVDISRTLDPVATHRRWSELYASFNVNSLPRGTWPKPFSRQLYFAQQLACNRILMERSREEIIGINGPPGTGKTTLLRDMIAEILVRRAEKLAGLTKATAAFGKAEGTYPRRFYPVSPQLRGFEMIVASQNNAAVENITRELPNIDDFCIDPTETDAMTPKERSDQQQRTIADIDLFAEVSDAILQANRSSATASAEDSDQEVNPSWGLISAPLGNKARREIAASAIFPHLKAGAVGPLLGAMLQRAAAAVGRPLDPNEFRAVDPEKKAAVQVLKQKVNTLLEEAQPRFEAEFATAQEVFRQALADVTTVQEQLRRLETIESERVKCRNRLQELEPELTKLTTTCDAARAELSRYAAILKQVEREHAHADFRCRAAKSYAVWRRCRDELDRMQRQQCDAETKRSELRKQLVDWVARAEKLAAETDTAQQEADAARASRPHAAVRWLKRWIGSIGAAEERFRAADARARFLRQRSDTLRTGMTALQAQIDSADATCRRCAASVLALEQEEAALRDGAEHARRTYADFVAGHVIGELVSAAEAAVEHAKASLQAAKQHAEMLERAAQAAELKRQQCEQEIHEQNVQCRGLTARREVLMTSLGITDTIWSVYSQGDEKKRQQMKPLMGTGIHRARMTLFIAAVRLHRAFVLASWPKLRTNLSFVCDVLKGKIEHNEAAFIADAWSSLSFLIPVVSTTFASASRLFSRLPPGSLGWAMIDEAGQAPPQYAVGLMRLVRRCVVVGDPLQLPPVVPMPPAMTEKLRMACAVRDARLHAHDCSVQMLADRMTILGSMARVPAKANPERRLWVGLPLFMHNRCANPIFAISNQLSYEDRMVLGRGEKPKPPSPPVVRPAGSFWLDVARPEHTDSQLVPDDLAAVQWLLNSLRWTKPKHLYVISPFREARDKIRQVAGHTPQTWRDQSIGTVHTFQGKQADCVILVLGGRSSGARQWASEPANLLNVAATRAKESLIVVGSHARWEKLVGPLATLHRVSWRPELKSSTRREAGIPMG